MHQAQRQNPATAEWEEDKEWRQKPIPYAIQTEMINILIAERKQSKKPPQKTQWKIDRKKRFFTVTV